MKLAIIGSRGFEDIEECFRILDLINNGNVVKGVVSGGAAGADRMAELWAEHHGIPIKVLPADWETHGKSAGFIRNNDIWDNADFGVAFWDGGSKGTAHSFNIARKQEKELFIFNYVSKKFYKNEEK